VEYRVQLASELLVDIEHDREGAERLLYKAARLAAVAGDVAAKEWIECELKGYPQVIPPSVEPWLDATGRRTRVHLRPDQVMALGLQTVMAGGVAPDADPMDVHITRETLPRLEDHLIPALEAARQNNLRTASAYKRQGALGGRPKKYDPTEWEKAMQRAPHELFKYHELTKRVRAELHRYVVGVFHRFAFSEIANSIFDRHKTAVDALLRATAPDVIDKIPAIYDRLAQVPDPEAISQAMVSVRRMIAAFADAVCPPRDQPSVDEAGVPHKLTPQEVLNRIDQHLQKCVSKTRRERLSKTVRALYDRASAGIKNDITAGEAQSLFLATYLTLGEIAEATGVTK
jgi:hypothetical protein